MATIIFVACLLLLLSLGLLVFKHFNSLKDYNHQAVHAYTVINQITEAESLLKEAENGTTAFLITKDRGFLKPMLSTHRLLIPALDSLGEIVRGDSMQKKDHKNAYVLAIQQLKISDSLINISEGNYSNEDSIINALMFRSKAIMSSYRIATKHMIEVETDKLAYKKKQIGYYQSRLLNNFTILFISVMLVIIALGLWVYNEFKKRIHYQTSLEENIIRLNQNNAELEQIAFAASHDLQEPLRKIRIFSDRLRMINKNKLQDENALIIERINRSAIQLHGLITDLVDLTNIVQSENIFSAVDLKDIITESELQFQQEINTARCKIIKGELPLVNGSATQLQRLFANLFSNALAFRSDERDLVIIISARKIKNDGKSNLPKLLTHKEYYHLQLRDNGIGFNIAFREKLFMPFQRLHNYGKDDLKRKGMGLAICKRIMVNHGGWIDADGDEGKGATLHLYFLTDALQER